MDAHEAVEGTRTKSKHIHSYPEISRQGGVALGLSEYTSRHCRLKLVEAAAAGIEIELKEKHVRGLSQLDPRVGTASVLAGILGVSVRTVQRWLSGGIQSCNVNAEKLIKAALEHNTERTLELLEKDLERHRCEFEAILSNLRQGGVEVSVGRPVVVPSRETNPAGEGA